MFPFWDLAIAPIFDAVGAKRVVEIGALRGENTIKMLEHMAADAELHVIDPLPAFDPAEHEEQFPGRYIFHRDLSLHALPDIPPVDVALVDGDHNWYTVVNELRLIAATSAGAGEPLPVLICHDVGWPYGRRDLYYAPEQIPEEHRQPWARKGIRPGRAEVVLGDGGMNPTMCNALVEGGPRNGVMTAVDDFVAEHPEPLRVIVLPIYFGLAIVVSQARIDAHPELATVLDRLESSDGRYDLMELAEETRIDAMMFQHTVFYQREQVLEQTARRYLDLLKAAVLDELNLENELRIDYLVGCIERGDLPEPEALRNPRREHRDRFRRLTAARHAGRLHDEPGGVTSYFPHTTMGRVRLDHLQECLDAVRLDEIAGDLVECGAGRGGSGIFLRGYVDAWNLKGRRVWIADTFRAAPDAPTETSSPLPGGGPGFPDLRADLNQVRDAFSGFGVLDDRVRFVQGSYAAALPSAPIETIALLRIGAGLGDAAGEALDALYDRVSPGGFIVIDDYSASPEVRKAVDDVRAKRGVDVLVERVDWSGGFWRAEAAKEVAPGPTAPATAVADRAPMAVEAVPTQARRELSVVVCFYNMKREAARTLHSLSRSYQQGIDDLDYEVIVVENGSAPDQKVGADVVRSYGPEFRYLDLGDEAQPSPAHALNRGMAVAGGDHICFMIDGAHVLTPGVLRYGMAGLRTYAPSVVATQLWYVGPGQQGDAMLDGYDQAYEDRLFDEISWPADGYQLFDIGHFVGERDWLDGLWESNCFFVPRNLLAQVGGFDESYSVAGGAYTNLDFYERITSTTDITMCTILGEGSFHQIHGGTTTNQPSVDERRRRIASYAQHYQETRGRAFRGPYKWVNYVGAMYPSANRSRARPRRAPNIFVSGVPDPDGRPESPVPIPESLHSDFVDAYWRSLRWQKTKWLGHAVGKPPADLIAYQELITRARPDWIIETGSGNGGRALFLASICDLVGHGRVISIGQRANRKRPRHPRLSFVVGDVAAPATVEKVRARTGGGADALVILGARQPRRQTVAQFDAYAPFVAKGSYLVFEDTIVNGHPVWPSFGTGPAEAVDDALMRNADFVLDDSLGGYLPTFNPGGYLRRVDGPERPAASAAGRAARARVALRRLSATRSDTTRRSNGR